MSTERRQLVVSGLPVDVVRKDIKNLHLGVYPPNGRIRVAAPLRVSDEAIRLAVVGKLAWVTKQRMRFQGQARQSEREVVSGESHYFLGRRYLLAVVPSGGRPGITLRPGNKMELRVSSDSDVHARQRILERWYRRQMRELVPPLLVKWQLSMNLSADDWRIKRMKTRWGTCNPEARRIWLNLELVKKPEPCLEYIIVHELAHLSAAKHDETFLAVMDNHLPQWRSLRQQLNSEPLAHEEWTY